MKQWGIHPRATSMGMMVWDVDAKTGNKKPKSSTAEWTSDKELSKYPLVYHYVFLTTSSEGRSLQPSQWVGKYRELWRLNDLPGAAAQYGAKLRLKLPSAYALGLCETLTEIKFSKTSSFFSGARKQDYGKLYQGWRNCDLKGCIRGNLTPGLKPLVLVSYHDSWNAGHWLFITGDNGWRMNKGSILLINTELSCDPATPVMGLPKNGKQELIYLYANTYSKLCPKAKKYVHWWING